ncbi:MAG: hypothetical protein AAF969_15295 [Bacteroidota bacterium]
MRNLFWIFIPILTIHGCKIADLRTPEIDASSPNREARAVLLLDKVISKHNLDKLANAENYALTATDNWRGLNAVVNPFPRDNELMELRFRPSSFDGQFKYLETSNDHIYGVQSFNFYRIRGDGNIKFKKKRSVTFTLPAIQYFFELPLRIKNAPILKYAGTTEFEHKTYDLVFATWDMLEPHKEHDQYLLYIDQETYKLSFASYTVRGIYLPAPKSVFGSIRFSQLQRNQDGILFPGRLSIQLNGLKNEGRALHTITIEDLQLNNFDLAKLYPDKGIEYLGDSKD